MERTSFADMRCSLARTLEKIGDWWTPLILRDLFLGVARFDALVEDLGLSRNLLTTRLKSLERHGIISRRAYQQKPVRHEYVLTEAGRDLVPILLALTAWGDRWAPPPEGAPLKFRHKGCGEIFEARITCSSCGELITDEDVEVLPGPGGAAAPGTKIVGRLVGAQQPRGPDRP